jgi:general secretion pathway protein D
VRGRQAISRYGMIPGVRFFAIRAAAFAAFVLISPLRASGDSNDVLLQRVSSVVADDGSLRITLGFNRAAPESRVIRSGEHTVHVVLLGAELDKNEHPAVLSHGEITQGTFAGFAGIGMRLDLRTRDRITVRTEAVGNTIIVHVPARRSDHEAPPAVAAAPPLPTATPGAFVTEIVRLSYADVSEVAGALVKGAAVPSNDVFNAASPFAPPPAAAAATAATPALPTYVSIPAATLLPKDTPQGVKFDDHVAIDRRLNAVILTGTRDQVDAYKALVSALDVPDRSVLLETQIVELTVSGAKSLGIDYSPNGTLTTATMGVSTGNKPVFGFNMGAAVSALAENGEAKILARPRILSLNNRPAAILSGEAVPIFTSVVIPGGGAGTVVNQQVQYINVGVSLQILPRIAADGRVTTQIFCEVSSIIDFVQNTPRIAVRQELTSAIVNDSESLIVGGLLQETEIKNLRKVPGLGNLPLVGGFFRDIDNTSQNTNLYIVITPHILNNGAPSPGSAFDLPPQPLPTIPPADPNVVPAEMATPPPAAPQH